MTTHPELAAAPNKVLTFEHDHRDLFEAPAGGFAATITKASLPNGAAAASNQASSPGAKARPFNFESIRLFRNANTHHSTCIETKVNSTVGLGCESEDIERVLGPLASVTGLNHSFTDLLVAVVDDYVSTGNGYIEVTRADGDIAGLHHIPAKDVVVFQEQNGYDIHYEVFGVGAMSAGLTKFAKYGDLESFISRHQLAADGAKDLPSTSEIIHLRRPTSMSRYYGYPDWLSAVAAVELTQCMTQERFDFFLNRGVPEFMLFVLGAQLSAEQWAELKTSLKAGIGLGNAHKSLAMNITGNAEDIKVQLEKLGLDQKANGDDFTSMHETLALQIVSAHRVPPLLAGIQIPGKLGSNNELPNALMACQALVIGPMQHSISTTLNATLGNPKLNGSLGKLDFKFKKITDEIDLGLARTVGGMREPLAAANANGRDLSAGLKKDLAELEDEELGVLLGQTFSEVLAKLAVRARKAA